MTSIHAPLDPVAVARLVDGYGPNAAIERWSAWSPRAIRKAAARGRRIIEQSDQAGDADAARD